jgi:CBS domain-containing protein
MAETARDLMTDGCECVNEGETVAEAAKKLAQMNVGGMPICGDDNKLKGMLTDRDIAVKVVAEGKDPSGVRAGDLAEGVPVTASVDDSADEVLKAMADSQVRRLPVLDETGRMVEAISR